MGNRFHQSQFLAELKSLFPLLTDQLNTEGNLFVFQMEVFRKHTQTLIDRGCVSDTKLCFELAKRYFCGGNRKMRKIIDVEFVENLSFKDTTKTSRKWAWELFPIELRELYSNFHGKAPSP